MSGYKLSVRPTDLQYEEGFRVELNIGLQRLFFLVRETKQEAEWYKQQVATALDDLIAAEKKVVFDKSINDALNHLDALDSFHGLGAVHGSFHATESELIEKLKIDLLLIRNNHSKK